MRFLTFFRGVHKTTQLCLRKVEERVVDEKIIVRGSLEQSDRASKLVKVDDAHGSCPLCRLNVRLTYQDVLVLEQFMRADGTVVSKQISGLCSKQQTIVERLVQQAHWAGLFPHHKPVGYNEDTERAGFRAFNRYFEDHSDTYVRRREVKDGCFFFIRRH